jgi:hypothetical protein
MVAMGQPPAEATAKKKGAFSERKARESRNLYLLLSWHHWRFYMDTACSIIQASYKYFAGAQFKYRTPFLPIHTDIVHADNQTLHLASWKAVPNNRSKCVCVWGGPERHLQLF